MSKSKHNYTQYSKKTSDPKPMMPEPEVAPVNTSPEVKIEVELVQETVDTVSLPKTVTGVVVNCAKLNVREEPDAHADVICVLDVMSEIMIDVNKSDNEWLKVHTAAGVEGYCMRKFVDARL